MQKLELESIPDVSQKVKKESLQKLKEREEGIGGIMVLKLYAGNT